MNATKTRSKSSWTAPLVIVAIFALAMMLPLGCTNSTSSEDNCPAKDDACMTKQQFLDTGRALFWENCSGCHDSLGNGTGHGSPPPVRNSDFFVAERLRPVRIVTLGLPNYQDSADTITVNGTQYSNIMPPILGEASDFTIAAVLSYVRDSLNGQTDLITVKEVKTERAKYPPQ